MISNHIFKKFTDVFASIPFNQTLGLRLDSIDKDIISMSFDMQKELIGNFMYGILHGGVISSVLDMAGGVAIMLTTLKKNIELPEDQLAALLSKCSTINLNVDFLQPGKGELFHVKANTVHSGNKISFAKMELHNHAGVLIATGTGTYMTG